MTVTKDTIIGDMLKHDQGIAMVLMQQGMHCVGCPASIGETLEQACAVHGLEVEPVVESVNKYLENNK